jgi:hypothetical protein
VQVAPADAAVAHLEQHVAGGERRHRPFLDRDLTGLQVDRRPHDL